VLTTEQRDQLRALHEDGNARFWGATPAHDGKLADVVTGDVVLFTGQNRVRAIGEVGAIFRNRALADLLWPPQAGGQSWHTVCSLLDLVVDRHSVRGACRPWPADRGLAAQRFYCAAKSTASHLHVRQALAQLLDYGPHSPVPAQRLTGLFPNCRRVRTWSCCIAMASTAPTGRVRSEANRVAE
jgi:hypothetical protein